MQGTTSRITIGRLMVAVLVAGLAMWGVFVIWPILVPSVSEQQAQTAYKEAKSKRQVTEYAVLMYQQESTSEQYRDKLYQTALLSFDAARARTRALARLSDQDRRDDDCYDSKAEKEIKAYAEKQVNAEIARTIQGLEREVEATRVKEQAKLEAYRKERDRRVRGLGF